MVDSMTTIAWFEIALGTLVLAWWAAALLTGQVPEVRRGERAIWFHIAAETLMAGLLIGGGIVLLTSGGWAAGVLAGAGLGTLLYSVVNSPGHYADLRRWDMVAVFGALTVLTAAALVWLTMV
jgi:hypothetical protein